MSIVAKSSGGTTREPIEAGMYVARCFQMLHIGNVIETIPGMAPKKMNKVRITWELPTEMRVFKEENGEQPLTTSKDFTLSMHEKSGLRAMLKGWRSKDFTEQEAAAFDITKLLGVACMLNITHKPSKDGSQMYEQISGVTPLPKGMTCPPQINPNQELTYDNWDQSLFDKLPDFLKDKIRSSDEYKAMMNPEQAFVDEHGQPVVDIESDLPF
jgi:hypothetical protein